MTHVSYSDLRNNLAKYMDEVTTSHAPLHVTRRNAGTVVMLSESDYDSMMETMYLLSSRRNAAELMEAIEQADRGEAKLMI